MTVGWGDTQDVTQAAADKLRHDIAAGRLHTRGTGSLPLDIERARVELTEEQRAHRASRPTSRRWRGLSKLDDRIDELTLRVEEARQEIHRAEERLGRAPDDDARTLHAWITAGERGKRPEASLYERQRERDALASPSKRGSGRSTRRSSSV